MGSLRVNICLASGIFLAACGDINEGWEVDGGGYLKYRINDDKELTIELEPDDVEVPFIKNSHHYFFAKTEIEESKLDIIDDLEDQLKADNIEFFEDVALVAAVGEGMRKIPGVYECVLDSLTAAGIETGMIYQGLRRTNIISIDTTSA